VGRVSQRHAPMHPRCCAASPCASGGKRQVQHLKACQGTHPQGTWLQPAAVAVLAVPRCHCF
jgi:hypothetical protein